MLEWTARWDLRVGAAGVGSTGTQHAVSAALDPVCLLHADWCAQKPQCAVCIPVLTHRRPSEVMVHCFLPPDGCTHFLGASDSLNGSAGRHGRKHCASTMPWMAARRVAPLIQAWPACMPLCPPEGRGTPPADTTGRAAPPQTPLPHPFAPNTLLAKERADDLDGEEGCDASGWLKRFTAPILIARRVSSCHRGGMGGRVCGLGIEATATCQPMGQNCRQRSGSGLASAATRPAGSSSCPQHPSLPSAAPLRGVGACCWVPGPPAFPPARHARVRQQRRRRKTGRTRR